MNDITRPKRSLTGREAREARFSEVERRAVEHRLARSNEFNEFIVLLLKDVSFDNLPTRELDGIGLCRFVFDMHNGAIREIDAFNIAAAMALVRPAFEALCRAIWLLYCAEEQAAQAWRNNRGPKLDRIVQQIDKKNVVPGVSFVAYDKRNGANFSSYVHGGFQAVVRLGVGQNSFYSAHDVLLTLDQTRRFAGLALLSLACHFDDQTILTNLEAKADYFWLTEDTFGGFPGSAISQPA